MKRLWTILVIAVVCVIAYRIAVPSATIRYRLTLNIDRDGQLIRSSGVVQVAYARTIPFLGASADRTSAVRGEAVQGDLGSKGLLLALLARGGHPRSAPEDIVLFAFETNEVSRASVLQGRRELTAELLPPVVVLREPGNPKSAEYVRIPSFPARIAESTNLTGATLEIVDAGFCPFNLLGFSGTSLTTGIDKKLPWLSQASSQSDFWKALHASGYRPNGSVEIGTLFKRPN